MMALVYQDGRAISSETQREIYLCKDLEQWGKMAYNWLEMGWSFCAYFSG
jgi:hypothetical protein